MDMQEKVSSSLHDNRDRIFSERDTYVHVRYMLSASVCRLSVVCLLSVTLVHPTQAVELFGNFFHHTIAQGLYFSGAKNRWCGTPLSP